MSRPSFQELHDDAAAYLERLSETFALPNEAKEKLAKIIAAMMLDTYLRVELLTSTSRNNDRDG